MDHLPTSRDDRAAWPIRVAVDLTHLRPGGENGGIKPFLVETLLWLGRQQRTPLQFLHLTCASTHAEVAREIARMQDEVICVRADDGRLPGGDERAPRQRLALPPPPDLLLQLATDVLYCPFGLVDFATPGIGTISTVVDVLHRDFPGSLSAQHIAGRERDFQSIVAVADALQCNSQHVVSRMHAHYGVAAERMFTVYNAVHGRFAAQPGGAADDVRSFPSPPFFFYPANGWKHKNHETLLQAYGLYHARALAAGIAPWPLVLTGHEDARWEELRAFALTLGLSEGQGVNFAGYVPPRDFGRLWAGAGALVFPSLHEGFGIPLLEAMQHDVPIVCGGDGSLREVGADACLFVDARSPEMLSGAMSQLSSDPALRQRLVLAGRRRLADFSLDHESGHLLDAIAGLARTAQSGRLRTRGISPDGQTERLALLALPVEEAIGRLTLRFRSLPVSRRVRLRAGARVTLGTFTVPAGQAGHEISVDCQPAGGALRLEVPGPADAHPPGVHLLAVSLQMPGGQTYSLFPS